MLVFLPTFLVFAALALFAYAVVRRARSGRSHSRYRPTLDWPSDDSGDAASTNNGMNDFVAGFVTGSTLDGMPGGDRFDAGHAGTHESPPIGHQLQQAEAAQPSALGGYEAAAQHDHGSTFDHAGGFDPGPSFDVGSGCDAGASFDCGSSFDGGGT